jgi:hypothetical protein
MNVQLEPTEDAWSLRWRRRDAPGNLTGATAERALRSILATVNDRGGRDDQIRGSLEVLDRSGGRDRYITGLARAWHANGAVGIHELSPDLRLALEMALHEETERRAMEGELATLEAEWRLAEEIAAIADNLFAPRNPTESPAAVSSERGST